MGFDKATFVKYKILNAIMLFIAINFCSLSFVVKRELSILHPDFKTLKYSSIFYLSLYQFILSIASKVLLTGTLVSKVQSIASNPSGGFVSFALTNIYRDFITYFMHCVF
ncbi:hypothetical protein [Wolbachia endosymbiont (group B) of Villa cingulata]|uniref:hypothetical protein n=1 Tax=Wolbachia endosymbiont (group B) of Villa cingulata TaxID=3066157 RepID=UPI0033424104